MSSRTPIRLTPHRGPLATPSTSAESSPTLSTPPSDISHCSDSISPVLDVAILQQRISMFAIRPTTQHQPRSLLCRRRREVSKRRLFGCGKLVLESLIYPASELARTIAGIVAFCLCIWGLLEWSSHASELSLSRQASFRMSIPRFPLPSPTRALRRHVNPSLCEPNDQHSAVLQFLSEQVHHAKALSSLSADLGSPLRTFLEAHRATLSRVAVEHNPNELPLAQEVDMLANVTELLDPPPLDFAPGSFIGRSFTLALEELGDLIYETTFLHASTRREQQDSHLHAIYWRTASNLLLEYTAARPRVRRLLQHLHAFRQQLPPSVSGHHMTRSIEGRLNFWWWKGIVRHPASSVEDGMQALVTGLDVALDNISRLIAYLDWITEHLARTTLRDVLKTRHRSDFLSCMLSLQDLFAQSKPSTSKRLCCCLSDCGAVSHARPERVDIIVPGSPTVRTER